VVDLDTDAPNGAPPPPGDAKLPSTHDGGVEGGSVAFSSSSKETAGSSWDQPLTIESDDEAVGLISTPCGDANPDRRIREVCLMIQKDMTPYGLEVLIFCQETVLKDCPKARSGGAALAAACVLQVPQETLVEWMRDAEKLFASEVPIAWLDATRPETFRKWLDVARRRRPTALALVPPDASILTDHGAIHTLWGCIKKDHQKLLWMYITNEGQMLRRRFVEDPVGFGDDVKARLARHRLAAMG